MDLAERARKLFGCATARVDRFPKRLFLIIGWNARSKGEWFNQKGEPQNFDYIRDEVVASGTDEKELWKSARFYHRLKNEKDKAKQLWMVLHNKGWKIPLGKIRKACAS